MHHGLEPKRAANAKTRFCICLPRRQIGMIGRMERVTVITKLIALYGVLQAHLRTDHTGPSIAGTHSLCNPISLHQLVPPPPC